ncbi:MAG TPA: ABC transporter ATP-binding protein [Azospirillaceae bacterium]|nr:ABC transporter ATP-binding protein [Azospirillaceae bacterium]
MRRAAGADAGSAPAAQFRAMLRDVLERVGRRFAAVAVLAVAAAAAEGAGLLLLLPMLDLLGVTGDTDGLPWLRALGRALGLPGALALYVVLVTAASAVVWARSVAGTALLLDYVEDLRLRLHAALTAMGWPALAARRQSDLTLALTAEVGRCGFAVDQSLQLLASVLLLPALLGAAFVLSPGFTLAGLALAAALALAVRPLGRRAHALGAASAEANRALTAEISDQVAGMRVLKGLGGAGPRQAETQALIRRLRARQLAQARAAATVRAAQRAAAAAAAALAVWAGIGLLALPLADMLVLLVVFGRLVPAALRVQESWRQIVQQLPVHARLMAELAAWRAAAEPAAGQAPPLAREIVLGGVSYRHPGGGGPALRSVDARIPAFATTALVGPSGAGKSTLVDILAGLVQPDRGAVLVDGVPLDGAARVAWRGRVGYVPQDAFLFHLSVRENLAMARPGADEAALWRALEEAAVADVVRALPQGLDTVVGDRGARLSGGERQRVALARALLREPDLLVLDEATSALDAGTESLVADALRRLQGRLTIVVVAHRPGTVRAADHVLLLEAGRVAAQGSWAEIRAAAGGSLAMLDMR